MIVLTYLISWIVIAFLTQLFIKSNVYTEYYENFAVNLLYVPGFPMFSIGCIVNELIYFLKYKRYKIIIVLIVILGCICGASYEIIPSTDAYRYYKDLHYVMEGTYCEEVQELKNINKEVINGKLSSTTIYIETTDFKFQVVDNIVEEKDFDQFKAKFNNVKKVKIRYLPNSETLLYIEPVTDGK